MTGSPYITEYIRTGAGWSDVEEQDRIPAPTRQSPIEGAPSWLTLIAEAEGNALKVRKRMQEQARLRRAERERRNRQLQAVAERKRLLKDTEVEMRRRERDLQWRGATPKFAARTIGGEPATVAIRPENFVAAMEWDISKCQEIARNGLSDSDNQLMTKPESVAVLEWCRWRTGIDPTQPTNNHQQNQP